ncbi:MAG: type I-C CRISPR-associated protein Cas5 [Chloroflexi bacterium]|mgnify:CR=1 FL=1|nr:type I-C CRISPR-associated protein Cas5 [Chloroflexota bacterium]
MGFGIAIRVKGQYALFTRPEMKVERVSYDVPTPSAARGIIEAIYWKPAIAWKIDKIHVLNPINFTNIRRNEISEKISTDTAKSIMRGNTDRQLYVDVLSSRQQRASMVLTNVDYIFEAHFSHDPANAESDDTPEKHYNIVLRRLRSGQYYHQPCLGTREFPAEVSLHEGPLPPSYHQGAQDLGWMLYDMDFSDPKDIKPVFFKAVMINGTIDLQNIQKAV